jgi:putative transposase
VSHKTSGYKSDLTDEQWEILEPMLVDKRKGPGRPMQLALRAVVNGILYVLRTGCQWAYLPHEYPNFNSVYYHYNTWSGQGTWERITTAWREQVRHDAERDRQPSVAILDSQSVKTTEVGGEHGFDGGKKVNGRKRHILVDTMGNLLSVVAHAAPSGERDGAKRLLAQLPLPLWERLEKILADQGYEGAEFQAWVKTTFGVDLEIAVRPPATKGFIPLPQRWVVERAFGCFGRSRRLSKDYEMLTENSEGFVYLASIQRLLTHHVASAT